jgi:translation initiation factor IF-2
MRARGAKVTDLVVLVVAADDGVMPQTVEAIAHAKAAKVPIIVAINKMDKHDANPARVKNELLQHEIQVEEFGGETLAVEVSALKGTGLDKLEEAILLQSEVLDLKANANRPADGAVVEAKLDKGRGPVATVLVQRGTLKLGDLVVAGSEWGRVRALVNDRGETVQSVGPSEPVEILGLSGAPEAGDDFVVVESEARAREVTDYRARKRREARQAQSVSRQSLDQLLQQQKAGEKRLLPVVLKADVQGSVEAIQGALAKLGNDEVGVQVLQAGVGGITESDVILAHASGAAIIGFNVRANAQARERSRRDGVDVRYYNIIYNIVDDAKAALTGLLAPETREKFLGNAEILEVFAISKVGKVAGCRVTEGVVRRGAKVRLIRDDVVIHEGELSTLQRFKDQVREVQAGQECGMSFANYDNIAKGDVIECYEVETIKRAL